MIYLKLLLTAIFWGGTFVTGRSLAQNVGPFCAAFLRFAVASLFLVFITWKVEGRFSVLKKEQILISMPVNQMRDSDIDLTIALIV